MFESFAFRGVSGSNSSLKLDRLGAALVGNAIEVRYDSRYFPFTTTYTQMPGPRNSKRQKKPKQKKRMGSPSCVATPDLHENVRADAGPDVPEETLLREPPIYDPGTGPRVKSMGEFLRSSFASEPTWDDELCAEFGQEEMLEMLRAVLPEEMALVSTLSIHTWHHSAVIEAKMGGN